MKQDIQDKLVSIMDFEIKRAKQNRSISDDLLDRCLDMYECYRTEGDYEWHSNVFVPEMPAIIHTQMALLVDQYFRTRDFVQCLVMNANPERIKSAEVAEKMINRTLSRKDLYHYIKFCRAQLMKIFCGNVYLETWWEKEIEEGLGEEVELDEEGAPVQKFKILRDCFNYDVLDSRNVFTSNEYAYSAQLKNFITVRSQKTLYELYEEKERHGYMNLEKLDKIKAPEQTEAQIDTMDKSDPQLAFSENTISNPYDVYKRYGKFWIMPDGTIGIDAKGIPKKGAKQKECVITYVDTKGSTILIGFNECPYKDSSGRHIRPIIRGLNKIHPTKDGGVGDGAYLAEFQAALNDSVNLANDRARLGTMPIMKYNKYAIENFNDLLMSPGSGIPLASPGDVEELKIDSNIEAVMYLASFFKQGMQTVKGIYPTTMGNLPQSASTTATAIAGAESNSTKRTQYESLTDENTLWLELYYQILQFTAQFATVETAKKLIGEENIDFFDPDEEYFYKPLTSTIETEQSKDVKIKRYLELLSRVVAIPQEATPYRIKYCWDALLNLFGDEYAGMITIPGENAPVLNGKIDMSNAEAPSQGASTANQYAVPRTQGQMNVTQ